MSLYHQGKRITNRPVKKSPAIFTILRVQ